MSKPLSCFPSSSFSRWHEPQEPLEKRVARLKESLDRTPNEPFVVITRSEYIEGCTGFGHPGFYGSDMTLQVGVRNGPPRYDKKNATIVLPTAAYVERDRREQDLFVWKRHDGPLNIGPEWTLHLNQPFPERHGEEIRSRDYSDFSRSLRIISGAKHVPLYFATACSDEFYDLWIKETGVDAKLKELQERDNPRLATYTAALVSLGHPLAPPLQRIYDHFTLKKRKNIILAIEKLCAKDLSLERNIAEQYVRVGKYEEYDERSRLVTKEDVDHFTHHEREERKQIRKDLAVRAKEGISLGLHKGDLVVHSRHTGIPIDLPATFTYLQQRYGIELNDSRS